ncbi:hydroxymethylglutaryl-CoA lyase [Minwuia sp.]|uniref:hydroxymethylglutaryl-CoA lyase n=1 Tax=Minwuia sp. TaxID=2493630 RepID=UPI003A95C1CC
MERDVILREVGMRDGLQMVKSIFPTDAKKQWIDRAVAAGMPEIEVCSFVPPHVVPQFQDHEEVVRHAQTHPDLLVSALVPNAKGAERGFMLGVDKLNFVVSASETHNQKNVKCTTEQSLERFDQIMEVRASKPEYAKTEVCSGVSTALGCTMEGEIDPKRVMWLIEELLKRGATEIGIADTVGYANPAQVKTMFTNAIAAFGADVIVAHFHDTRGLGLANALAAYEAGCRKFDASLAGLGGCPFAPAATGNVVMDDLVFMFEAMGVKTGIDLDALLSVREILESNLPDEPLHGMVARASVPKGFVPASMAAAAE